VRLVKVILSTLSLRARKYNILDETCGMDTVSFWFQIDLNLSTSSKDIC